MTATFVAPMFETSRSNGPKVGITTHPEFNVAITYSVLVADLFSPDAPSKSLSDEFFK